MDTAPGNNPPSGQPQQKKKRRRRRRKRAADSPQPSANGNGKTDWKGLALALQENVKQLEENLARQREKYNSLKSRFKVLADTSLDERAAVKLRVFNHLWGQLINFQAKCPEDKKRIEELVDQTMPALKNAVIRASKPIE